MDVCEFHVKAVNGTIKGMNSGIFIGTLVSLWVGHFKWCQSLGTAVQRDLKCQSICPTMSKWHYRVPILCTGIVVEPRV